jgi:ArsR family transcriptional regulator, arsenate/arsenite/antimonite-responsive transcriptional repressor / arsenate reductase (thioredoxin)
VGPKIDQSGLTYRIRLVYLPVMNFEENHTGPDFLKLSGHPLRWKLLAELAQSDRMVHELTDLLGEAPNLVSYHLGKLRDACLVSTRRSSADRRDAYYSLDLSRVSGLLATTGAALHPALRLIPPPIDSTKLRSTRVLFLCTGNSARSQMAEGMLRDRSGGIVEAYSAGSHPKPMHPNAVRVMRDEYAIDLSSHASKHLGVFTGQSFECVVSLCDRVREVCPEFPGRPQVAHWSIPDPAAGHTDDNSSYAAFRQTASELETRIAFLLAALADRKRRP